MGINITVQHVDPASGALKEVPIELWDFVRHSGDRAFLAEVLRNEHLTVGRFDAHWEDWFYRPKDIDGWIAWDKKQSVNNGRWSGLAEMLQRDETLWVSVSY